MSAKVTTEKRNPRDLAREIRRQKTEDDAARLLEKWLDEAEERGRLDLGKGPTP